MQVASKKLFDTRKEELLTSHLKKLGDSLTCLLQRLPEYSTLVVNKVNGEVAGNITSIFCQGQTNAAGIGIIGRGDS